MFWIIILLALVIVLFGSSFVWPTLFALLAGVIAGTIGFWTLVSVELIFLLYCLDNSSDDGEDKFYVGWSTFSVLCVLLIFQFATSFKPLTYMWNHPLWSAIYVAGYFAIGIGWSFLKWLLFSRKQNRKVEKVRKEFLRIEGIPGDEVPEDKLLKWEEFYSRDYRRKSLADCRVRASEYKAMLVGWVGLWPISFVWTIINDPIVKLLNNIYELLQHSYQRISDYVFADVNRELEAIKILREAEKAKNEAISLAKDLEQNPLTTKLASDRNGELESPFTLKDLMLLLKKGNLEVDEDKINFPEPITTVGVHDIEVDLHPEVKATIKLIIHSDNIKHGVHIQL